jgi:hypothetical protein
VRFYNIVITNPATGKVIRTYTSYVNGAVDPGALNVVLDIPVAPGNAPAGNAHIEIQGISFDDITQASDLNNKNITVSVGMSKGLPLANPAQQNVVLEATIQQSYANWIGTLMSLELLMVGGSSVVTSTATPGTAAAFNDIVLNWTAGVPLGPILENCLSIAFPGFKVVIADNLNPGLVRPNQEMSFHYSFNDLATFIQTTTQALIGGNYSGVQMTMSNNKITVFDNTPPNSTAKPKQIAFQDLIGQPTWKGPSTISVQTVMRGDLAINDYFTMPNTPLITSAASFSNYKTKPNFSTTVYQITELRHVGDFRQPDGASWSTIITGVDNR